MNTDQPIIEKGTASADTTTVPFQRENRYIVFKLSDLDDLERTELQLLAREVDGRRKILGKESMKCVVVESDWPEYMPTCAAIERRVNGTEEAPITLETLYPQKCPITRRDFFMIIEHPELGDVPTYGGPFDSYTIPEMDGEPDQPFHERELFQRRYDHDAGAWVDGVETIPLRVINDEVLMAFEDQVNASRASLEHHCNHWEAIAKRLPKAVLGGVDLPLASETGNAAVVIKVIDMLENEIMNKDMQLMQFADVPDGYKLVLVPSEAPAENPDYAECSRQACVVTGMDGPDPSWLSIYNREINRFIIQMNQQQHMMPWKQLFVDGWRIVGMNHYRLNDTPHLFCSMAKNGQCITAEGTNEAQVFHDLEMLAGGGTHALICSGSSTTTIIEHKEWCAAAQDVRDGFDHIRDCDCGAQ